MSAQVRRCGCSDAPGTLSAVSQPPAAAFRGCRLRLPAAPEPDSRLSGHPAHPDRTALKVTSQPVVYRARVHRRSHGRPGRSSRMVLRSTPARHWHRAAAAAAQVLPSPRPPSPAVPRRPAWRWPRSAGCAEHRHGRWLVRLGCTGPEARSGQAARAGRGPRPARGDHPRQRHRLGAGNRGALAR
jgi:hypothetical protein